MSRTFCRCFSAFLTLGVLSFVAARGDDGQTKATKAAAPAKTAAKPQEGEASSEPKKPAAPSEPKQPAAAKPDGVVANKPGKPVSFMRDVAPILVENCIACHNPRKSESKYVMTTFAQLAKGGQQGEGITLEPGEPDESHLVELIRPDGKPRMPYKQDPLPQGKDRDHRALGRRRGQVRRQLARRGLDDPACARRSRSRSPRRIP